MQIAEITEERDRTDHQLCYTHLSNGYWVSTICRDAQQKSVDQLISGTMALYDVTPADLGRPGHLDMEGDFETMVFHDDNGYDEVGFARYETEEAAIAGHREMVERWRRM